jgi:uncharacterized protein YebE (UPF0316 family)
MPIDAHAVLMALTVFCLRVTDVSIGTVRVIFTIRGMRLISMCLGFLESGIFIFAVSRVLSAERNWLTMIGYASGFATGTFVGITLEQWIASGSVLVRIISRNHAIRLKELLTSEGFGVTAVRGQGYDGDVMVLFVVAARRKKKLVLENVQGIDPDAFITVEPVSQAIGGYPFTAPVPPESMKK